MEIDRLIVMVIMRSILCLNCMSIISDSVLLKQLFDNVSTPERRDGELVGLIKTFNGTDDHKNMCILCE